MNALFCQEAKLGIALTRYSTTLWRPNRRIHALKAKALLSGSGMERGFGSVFRQLQAIASHVGMSEVFRLRAADVYRVLEIERVAGFTRLPEPPPSERADPLFVSHELAALRVIVERINRAELLGDLLDGTLQLLDEFFGFRHALILIAEDKTRKLLTIASRGYPANGVGSEIGYGEGLIGTVALAKRGLRLAGLDHSLRYARAARDRADRLAGLDQISREIPLPGLQAACSQLAVPLQARGRLVGVLAVESRDPGAFQAKEETLLAIIGGQLAAGIDQLGRESEEAAPLEPGRPGRAQASPTATRIRSFCFFREDDCVFVDGEYLIRNVPGRILWRILRQYQDEGRTEFTNRALRMDGWLGLPELKDNLESRLILLRKRLEQKCPDIRLVPRGRGRFALETDVAIALSERSN